MARREIEITISEPGDDYGKTFYIRRMSAWDADRWGRRVIYALLQSQVEIEDLDIEQGIAGLVGRGLELLAYIPPDTADALFDALTDCVFRRPDPRHPGVEMPLRPDDVEDALTIAILREAVFRLHTDFFSGAQRLFSPDGKATSDLEKEDAPRPAA